MILWELNGLWHWIGFVGKSLTGNPWVFTIKYRAFRLKFSHHPISNDFDHLEWIRMAKRVAPRVYPQFFRCCGWSNRVFLGNTKNNHEVLRVAMWHQGQQGLKSSRCGQWDDLMQRGSRHFQCCRHFFHSLHICRWNVNISDDGKDGFAMLESAGFRWPMLWSELA